MNREFEIQPESFMSIPFVETKYGVKYFYAETLCSPRIDFLKAEVQIAAPNKIILNDEIPNCFPVALSYCLEYQDMTLNYYKFLHITDQKTDQKTIIPIIFSRVDHSGSFSKAVNPEVPHNSFVGGWISFDIFDHYRPVFRAGINEFKIQVAMLDAIVSNESFVEIVNNINK